MKILNFPVVFALVSLLAACSSTGDTKKSDEPAESRIFDYKAPPREAPMLEVPPELTAYASDERYAIPGEGESGTRYSEYQQNGGGKKNNVLPVVRNAHIEGGCNQRWLVVADKPENVWPLIKSFWTDNGLSILVDTPQAGIMETDWQENLAKIPKDSLKGQLGQFISNLKSSGERDKYRTRVQRSKDGNSTEIYITHYGLKLVQNKDETGMDWIDRPSDPELEATMLQLLMSKMGGGSGVLYKNDKAAGTADKAQVSQPKLKKLENGNQVIQLSEAFDKSWRRVGLALDQAGIVLADKDRSKGIFFLSSGKDDVKPKQDANSPQRKQVVVKETAGGCEISVNNGLGNSDDSTRKIMDALFKALGKI